MESTETLTLMEALGLYTGSLKPYGDQDGVYREIFRFVQWCGSGRHFKDIAPHEIEEYSNQVTRGGTTPEAAERLQAVRKFLLYATKKGIVTANLAREIKVRPPRTRGGKGKGQDAQHLNQLTPEGHAQLVDQLERLKAERGPIAIQIRKAAADKDVRENAPLEAAREQLGYLESRISSLEATLRTSVVIDPSQQQVAQNAKVGTRVSIKDLSNGREMSYTLVSAFEANPLEGRISDVSPMGKALVGHATGQEVEAVTPRGKVRYRILEIST